MDFAKFLRTPFFAEHLCLTASESLLMSIIIYEFILCTTKKINYLSPAKSFRYVNYTKHNSIMKLNRFTDILFCLKTLTLQKKKCFAFFNKSPLKMMEKTFYFILKALFVLQIPKFLS